MDSEIKQWQELWEKQKSSSVDVEQLLLRLNKLERISRIQKIVVPVLFSFSITMMIIRLSTNWYNLIAILLVVIAMLSLLIPLYKTRLNKIEGDGLSNTKFVENQISKLKRRLLMPTRYLMIFIVLFVLAINIGIYGSTKEMDMWIRVEWHGVTVILLAILLWFRMKKIKQFKHQINPLIEDLKKL